MGELCKWVLFGEVIVSHHGQIQEDDTSNQNTYDK
jgi:hypothetical protein